MDLGLGLVAYGYEGGAEDVGRLTHYATTTAACRGSGKFRKLGSPESAESSESWKFGKFGEFASFPNFSEFSNIPSFPNYPGPLRITVVVA